MKLFYVILVVIGIYVLAQGFLIVRAFSRAGELTAKSQPFEYVNEDADFRILVLGDSTAVGTGASSSEFSTAGRLYREFENASLINLSKNGAKISDVLGQAQEATDKFDLILIHAGANDTLYFTNPEKARKDLRELFLIASQKSDKVIYLSSGNMGSSPIFIWPTPVFYGWQSRKMLSIYEEVANEVEEVYFVNLFYEDKNDPFRKNPRKYYAPDNLHLSDEGYGLWYEKIREVMREKGII